MLKKHMAMAPLNQQRSATDALCGDFRTWCDSCAVHKHLCSRYTYHWSHLILMQIDDASDFANEVLISHPSIPHFVGGQSLGGLISTLVALQDQSKWTGMILCSAAMNIEWTLALRQDMSTKSLPVLPADLDVAAADTTICRSCLVYIAARYTACADMQNQTCTAQPSSHCNALLATCVMSGIISEMYGYDCMGC